MRGLHQAYSKWRLKELFFFAVFFVAFIVVTVTYIIPNRSILEHFSIKLNFIPSASKNVSQKFENDPTANLETHSRSVGKESNKVTTKSDFGSLGFISSSSIDYYNSKSKEFREGLRQMGLESGDDHEFKSPFIITPHVYSDHNNTVLKPPGKREVKVISFHEIRHSKWVRDSQLFSYNKDFKKCPYSECVLDTEGKMTDKAHLVWFICTGMTNMPKTRPPGQLWALGCWESPVHWGYRDDSWKSVFNLTMGHRHDLDIGFIHDYLMWRNSNDLLKEEEYVALAKQKTKTAVWMVSHCPTHSKRLKYVKEMQKYVDVDIYGRCGNLSCPRSKQDKCQEMMNTTYKFYLGFENSFCDDYSTWKFFGLFQRKHVHIVPVVRSGLDHAKYFPENILVDTMKFKSAKELALHLKELGSDIPKYAKMLQEKDRLVISENNFDWCDVCEGLHTGMWPGRVIPDVSKETHRSGVCWEPTDIK